MVDKITRSLYYSLFFVTPLLMFPFTSELFEFNKMIFIYLTAVLVGFFWVLKIGQEKKVRFKRTPLDIPILIFLLSQILSTLFSIDKLTSLFGYYGRFNGGLFSTIAYIALFYGFVNFSNLIEKEKILKTSLLASFISIIWGLPGRFGFDLTCWTFTGELNNSCWTDQFRPSERMFSTLGQPNWFGAYLVINFFLGLYFLLKSAQKNQKSYFIYLAYLGLNFLGIIFSRSRSALLALIVGLIVFGSYYFVKNSKNKDFTVLLKRRLAPLVVIMLVIVFIFKTGIERIDKFINLEKFLLNQKKIEKTEEKQTAPVSSEVSESFDIRKIVWKGAIDLGFKYPLFGTGVETFAYSYYFVRPIEHNLTSEWDYLYNKAHNEYLNFLATTGFVGLASYLLMVTVVITLFLKRIKKEKDLISLVFFCAYLSILITNFFGFSTTTINVFFYLIPGFLIKEQAGGKPKLKFLNENRSRLVKLGILVFLFLLFSLILYYFADIKYATSQNYSRIGDYQSASTLLDQALRLKKEHVFEDKLSYSLANLAFFAAYQNESGLTKSLANLSQTYNDRSLKSSPKNVLYWKTKAKNHYLFYQINFGQGQLQEGLSALESAEKLSPTDPKIPYTEAIFYSLLEDEVQAQDEKIAYQEKALNQADKSIKLKADFRDGYLLKGQLLKKYGNQEEADKVFNYILKMLNPNDAEVKEELLD